MEPRTYRQLLADNEGLKAQLHHLRERLDEVEETIAAVRAGQVDALVVSAEPGEELYVLERIDRPYRLLLESMAHGAAVVDVDGRIAYCNRSLAELLRRSRDEVTGSHWRDYLSGPDALRLADAMREVSERTSGRVEVLVQRPGASPQPIEIVIHPSPIRAISCFVITDLGPRRLIQDLVETRKRLSESDAEYRRLYAELREEERRKDEFLAVLAHELRNPLAPLRNALHLLRTEPEREVAERARAIMERQLDSVVRLVDDILDVSRLMSGKVALRKEPIELGSVFTRAVDVIRAQVEVEGQELIVALPEEPIRFEADEVRIAQAIGNILSNAVKYTDKGGSIFLSGERDQDRIVIRIRDTGIGIPPDVLPRVFDLFVQADRSLTRSQGGLGIGLTLVKRLVEMHGGRVQAASDGLGRGCEFTVTLPIASPSDIGGDDERRDVDVRAESRRVLVVEDDSDSAQSLAMLLQIWGHHVEIAHDGHQALDAARSFGPEIVLLDIGIPGLDGYEVAERLRSEHGAELKLIALTGYGREDDQQRSREAGFDRHITKPLEPPRLREMLASFDFGTEGDADRPDRRSSAPLT
ncbi:MAG TPA: ATP-binding protein [Candidatus Eisenbacteria bacterium]|nr:ATP-binding protein [Candidatus Eisenbacteria bacterium]